MGSINAGIGSVARDEPRRTAVENGMPRAVRVKVIHEDKVNSTRTRNRLSRLCLMLLGVLFAVTAWGGDLRTPDGRLTATASADGRLRDPGGRLLLRFEADGDVRDPSGRTRYAIDPRGRIRDPAGRLLGTIASDGAVRDPAGRLLGRVEPDGDVRDPAGRKIGAARDVRRNWAALYYFFL